MPGYLGKTTNLQRDVVGQQALTERETQWGELDGEIVSFDAAKQTATVQPLYQPKFLGKPTPMPELLEVPVRFVRAGNGGVTFPVKAGDKVTLRPKMRSSENYNTDGEWTASDRRSFNLSDYEAYLDGGESLTDPIPAFDSENVHVRFDPQGLYGIRGSQDGKIKIEGSEGNIYDLIATFMELVASDELMINYGSSMGTGHRLFNRDALLEIAAKIRTMAL